MTVRTNIEEGKVSWLELSSNDSKETTWRRERYHGSRHLLMTVKDNIEEGKVSWLDASSNDSKETT